MTGVFLRCPDLSGAVVGPGTHTLQVSAALSDGRTLTDTVTWTVRQ